MVKEGSGVSWRGQLVVVFVASIIARRYLRYLGRRTSVES